MNFQPWRGDCYGLDNNLELPKRLLVLGESHYGDTEKAYPDLTKDVVEEVFAKAEDVPYRYRFFTSLFKALRGAEREATREALAEFCHAIAFYNFVQEMIEAPGVRPSEEQWAGGVAPFFKCLSNLKPSHIVACGFALWDNLPSERFSDLPAETERSLLELLPEQYQDSASHRRRGWAGRYENEGGGCLILKIHHPSIAFSAAEWHPLLQHFLKL